MNYPARLGAPDAGQNAAAPPQRPHLERIVAASIEQHEGLAGLVNRLEQLADRLTGSIPQKESTVNGASPRPDSMIGQLDAIVDDCDFLLQRLHGAVERLERL